ncbi:MAG: LPD38 domain-containing protein, partial [Nitrosopumilus sp.]
MARQARKFKTADEFVKSNIKTTNGVKHLNPDKYNGFTAFVRDVEKLNPIPGGFNIREATRQIEAAKKIWGSRDVIIKPQMIDVDKIVLAESPLDRLPKPGRKITGPIQVEKIDGVFTLVDGRHRLDQAKANGEKQILAKLGGDSQISKLADIFNQAKSKVISERAIVSAPQPSKLLTATGKPKLNTPRSRQVSLGHDTALKSDRLHTTGATTPPPKTVIGPPQPPRSIKLPSEGSVPSKFIKSSIDKIHNLYTQSIDRFHPITRIAREAGEATGFKQKVGQKATVRNALTAHYGTGSTATHHVDFELAPILKRHNVNDLREAAIAFRDLELAGRGIKGSRAQSKADQALTNLQNKLGKEEFNKLKDSLQELYSYQDNLVQKYLVDTGVLTPQQFSGMKQANKFYIPFKRIMDTVDEFLGLPSKQVGSVSSQNIIRGIKGSERELVDPIESILANTYKIVGLGNRQKVAKAIVNLGDSLPDGVIRRLDDAELIGTKNTISLFENGRTVRYEVPREISETAKGLNEEQLAAIVKIMSVPTQIFRVSATGINPEFVIPNVSRDLQSAIVNVGINPLRWVRGLAATIRRDDLFQEFLKAGGKTSRISIDQPVLKKTVREITGKGISVTRPSDLLRIAQIGGEWSEQATRVTNFQTVLNRSLKQGFNREEALSRAAYAAQEGTVNFARRGSMTKNVNAIIAFLNARVQGTDRLIRSIKDNPVGAGTRLGIVAITPALVTRAWNEQFEGFNDERILSDRTKRLNYIIMLSDEPIPALGGAQYIKVPKGEIGSFSNIIDDFIDFVVGKGGDAAEVMKETLLTLSPIERVSDVIPTVLKPPIEVGINKNFFTGFDIVPEWKQSFPKGFQDSSFTAPLFRFLGQKINQSPAKLQHLAEGYGTGLVRIAEQVAQPFVPEEFVTAKNKRGADIQRIPVARRVFGGARQSELQQAESKKRRQDFLKKEIGTVRNAVKRGEIDTEQGFAKIKELQTEMGETIVPGGIIELKA